jgi:hypothetical protein
MIILAIMVLGSKRQYSQRRLTRFKVEAKSLTTNLDYCQLALQQG